MSLIARYARISIHAAREGGDAAFSVSPPRDCSISIHAAREGGDPANFGNKYRFIISIHAAREGGDGQILHFMG